MQSVNDATCAKKNSWQQLEVALDQTHHTLNGHPAYDARFHSILKFHEPGLAPVLDESGAYHIDSSGTAAYDDRFLRTFGFYHGRAAVQTTEGCYHILPDGKPCYSHRYAWCGNYQQHYCVVKDVDGRYFHLDHKGERPYATKFKYVGDFRDGYAVAFDDEGFGTHIDFQGRPLHGKRFIDLDCFHKGFARAKDEKGWFHIDQEGAPQYSFRYKSIEPFYNGVSRVETSNGSFLLIDEKGHPLTVLKEQSDKSFHAVSAQLVSFWQFYTLDAACRLNVFDCLPSSSKNVADHISLPISSTEKLLNALAEMEYVRCQSGIWDLLPKGRLLTTCHPFSLLPAQQLWREEHYEVWNHLIDSLKTEKSAFEALYNTSWFDYLEKNPEKKVLYHRVISTYAKYDYQMLCSKIDFEQHRTVLDLGGSGGTLLFEVLSKHSHLHGILLDLPGVISLVEIPPHLKHRTQLFGTDFFQPWPSFDVDCALLTRVLHDWSDENCVHLLRQASSVCNILYIVENVLQNHNGSLLNINMLLMTEGKERSRQDFERLFADAELQLLHTIPLNEVSTIFAAQTANRFNNSPP
ncbi:MAG: methyltransferase [Waddliaceae bacterium]